MIKRKSWSVGIILFLILAGFLWYQVVSSTDIAKVGQEEQNGVKIERPRIPPLSLPKLPEIEKKVVHSPSSPEQIKALKEADYSILRNTPCLCGCKLTLIKCRCPVALEQMKKMGIVLEDDVAS